MSLERGFPNLISVILPARNAAATIRMQLDALAAQDYAGSWELVVADNGSSDATREVVLASASRIPALYLIDAGATVRNGAAAARNRGAALAHGDLLAFCDADDVVAPNWLSAMATQARNGDLMAGAIDAEKLNLPSVRAWQVAAGWQRSATQRFLPFASTANCAIWADAFAALNGFDENHPGAEDKDLSWRALLAGLDLRPVPEAVVAYRQRPRLWLAIRQRYRWGLADARLYRDFAPAGLSRAPLRDALRAWGWSIATVPAAAWSHSHRARWAIRTAQQAGRLVGSMRDRVVFP